MEYISGLRKKLTDLLTENEKDKKYFDKSNKEAMGDAIQYFKKDKELIEDTNKELKKGLMNTGKYKQKRRAANDQFNKGATMMAMIKSNISHEKKRETKAKKAEKHLQSEIKRLDKKSKAIKKELKKKVKKAK